MRGGADAKKDAHPLSTPGLASVAGGIFMENSFAPDYVLTF